MSRRARIALIAVTLIAAAAAFVALRPEDEDDPAPQSAPTGRESPERAPHRPAQRRQAPATTTIRVADGEPEGGVRQIEGDKGETVVLVVRSPDTSDEVHLHGYDIFRDLRPGRPARLRFRADIDGVFEIELERSHRQIAELTVEP